MLLPSSSTFPSHSIATPVHQNFRIFADMLLKSVAALAALATATSVAAKSPKIEYQYSTLDVWPQHSRCEQYGVIEDEYGVHPVCSTMVSDLSLVRDTVRIFITRDGFEWTTLMSKLGSCSEHGQDAQGKAMPRLVCPNRERLGDAAVLRPGRSGWSSGRRPWTSAQGGEGPLNEEHLERIPALKESVRDRAMGARLTTNLDHLFPVRHILCLSLSSLGSYVSYSCEEGKEG